MSARRTRALVTAAALSVGSLSADAQEATDIRIARAGEQPSVQVPAEYFTGNVRLDAPFKGSDAARVSGGTVTFEPGARTAWHSHPLGQTLIVVSGVGYVQNWNGPRREIRPGDTVWIAPGVKHWHGATATTAMSHIAIAEELDGKVAEWMEKVSDEQYAAPPQATSAQ